MNKSFFLLLLVSSLAASALAQTTSNLVETPLAADTLVDSMGVNIHMTYADTAYSNEAAVKNMLKSLGIRHVRDGGKFYIGQPGYNTMEFKTYGDIASLGIGFDLILDFNHGTDPNPMTPTLIGEIQALARAHNVVVDSYEGPNEIDSIGPNSWLSELRTFMPSMYSSVKSNPATSAIPVIGNSLAGPNSDWILLGNMTSHEDFGNMHPYANTQHPSYNFDFALSNQVHVSGSQNLFITEAGWSNAVRSTDNSPNVNEDVASRYMSRLFLETLLRGWPRTFVYELVDEQPDNSMTKTQQHFGLFRNDYSAKPAATVIANTIALMSDKGAKVNLRALTYSLTTSSPAVHHLLFQKGDGTYWLALWQEVSNWKGWNAQGTVITNPDVPVELTFPTEAASLQTYRPHSSTGVVDSFSNQKSVTLMVPDHALFVKIMLIPPPSNLRATVQ
jgi:hypothetical protein